MAENTYSSSHLVESRVRKVLIGLVRVDQYIVGMCKARILAASGPNKYHLSRSLDGKDERICKNPHVRKEFRVDFTVIIQIHVVTGMAEEHYQKHIVKRMVHPVSLEIGCGCQWATRARYCRRCEKVKRRRVRKSSRILCSDLIGGIYRKASPHSCTDQRK